MAGDGDRLDRIEKALEALIAENRRRDEAWERRAERLSREVGRVANGLGYFAEGLVAPSLPDLLRAVGIDAPRLLHRARSRLDGKSLELDIVAGGRRAASGAPVLVVVEVANQLTAAEVTRTLEKLPKVWEFFPEHAGYEVVGGVAGMYVSEDAILFAERQGLLVFGPGEDVARCLNRPGFEPKVWRAPAPPPG